MREIEIINDEFYHICNRSTEGIKIFTNSKDYNYLLEGLFFANSVDNLPDNWRRFSKERKEKDLTPQNRLVEFNALILMPNHIHFLLKQLTDGGAARLMQRVFNSYAKYFNIKYNRKGSLFMGPYKAVPIEFDNQARHIMTYIHGNALDLIEPGWREGKIKNWKRAEASLLNFKWSSLNFFLRGGNVHPLISKLINKEFGEMHHEDPMDYLKAIREWGVESPRLSETSLID